MTQQSPFCQLVPQPCDPETALRSILEVDGLPMEAVLLATAGLQFIDQEFDERMTVLAAEHEQQTAFENGYGM